MKRRIAVALTLLCLLPALARAQRVSIAELHEQAEAMGRWTRSYEVDGKTVEIDAPILVPDVEKLPVLEVEMAKPFSLEQYDALLNGEEVPGYETARRLDLSIAGGQTRSCTFIMGWGAAFPLPPEPDERYLLYMGTGDAQTSDLGFPTPHTYHYAWEIPFDEPLVKGSTDTLSDVMQLWQGLLDQFYTGQGIELEPYRVSIYGSVLSDRTPRAGDEKRLGHYEVEAVQLLDGVPVLGRLWTYSQRHVSTDATSKKLMDMLPYHRPLAKLEEYQTLEYRDAGNYHIGQVCLSIRAALHEDIPLAPLEEVLLALEAEIEKGTLRDVYALRLGYLLYADPEIEDYVFAVPGWIAECQYVAKKNRKVADLFAADTANPPDGAIVRPWNDYSFSILPVSAQDAELMLFDVADESVLAVPQIIPWEDER